MDKLKAGDIRRDGERIYCHLPEPDLLDFSVDPTSIRSMTSSTAIPRIVDIFSDGNGQRALLEMRLYAQATQFAQDNNLRPTRDELVKQLNSDILELNKAIGMDIHFE